MNRTLSRVGALLPLVVLLAGAAVTGCDKPKPTKSADDVVPPVATATADSAALVPTANAGNGAGKSGSLRGDTDTPDSGSVLIEPKILASCGDIPEAHFAFNSTTIEGQAATALEALARCFVDGPLKGRNFKLVGHTDPRGTTTYNYGLGQRRADSVSNFLQSKKVLASQVATSSVGENDAAGLDENGWAKDRRVDVFLAE